MKSEGTSTNEVIWTSNVQLPHLSHEECLPVIGSCQVSSILSTLETTEKILPSALELTPNLELNVLNSSELKLGNDITTNINHNDSSLTNFIIIKEQPNISLSLQNELENEHKHKRKKDLKSKPDFEEMLYFSCYLCPFLCTKDIKISEHIENFHRNKKNSTKLQLKCPACPNIFYHKIPLRSHLIHDHEVTNHDIGKFIQAVMYFSKKDHAAKIEIDNSKTDVKDLKLNIIGGQSIQEANNNPSVVTENDEHSSDILEQEQIIIEPLEKPASVLILPTMDITEKNTEKIFCNIIKQKNSVTKLIEQKKTQKCTNTMCKVRLIDIEKMSFHIKSHTEHGFVCLECNVNFAFWKPLTGHLWRMHKIDMELFACDMCDYKTYSLGKLNNIHRPIHFNVKSFLCEICKKGFKNRKQLRNHKTIHKEKSAVDLHHCEECNKNFSDKRQLKIHLDGVHSQIKPFLCSYCGYKGASKSALKMHTRIHTGEKPFTCDTCDYATADHNSLRRHKLRHTGQKPYKCKHCEYACIQSSTYKAHLKTKHPGLEKDLMFSCKFCQYRSVNQDKYMTHLSAVHKVAHSLQTKKKVLDQPTVNSHTEEIVVPIANSSSS